MRRRTLPLFFSAYALVSCSDRPVYNQEQVRQISYSLAESDKSLQQTAYKMELMHNDLQEINGDLREMRDDIRSITRGFEEGVDSIRAELKKKGFR